LPKSVLQMLPAAPHLPDVLLLLLLLLLLM
jgi:hypothetical protein